MTMVIERRANGEVRAAYRLCEGCIALPIIKVPQVIEPALLRIELPPAEIRETLQLALDECDGNKLQAALLLGITRQTLYARLKRHGLCPSKAVAHV